MQDLKNAHPIHRQEDNELLGYILHDDTEWLPLTIFGYALDHCLTEEDAMRVVNNKGLESLMDTWQYFDSKLDDWFNCAIIEAKKNKITIRITDYGHPDAHQTLVLHAPSDANFKR
jgi:hypothetical protein